MTRFRDALDGYADQAPPLGTIADRVLADSARSRRRRRLRLVAPVSAAGLLAASVFGLVAAGLLPWQQPNRDVEPATPPLKLPMTVAFPEAAPSLPDKGVGRAVLAYSPGCEGDEDGVDSCEPWRVMTADGKHWTVEDAAWPDDKESAQHYDRGSLTVSPDGTRIAYFRDNGAFVIRDLESGSLRQVFSWAETPWKFDDSTPEVTWSPDSRWVGVAMRDTDVVDGRSTSVNPQNAELVDTKTMRTRQMPGSCCFNGLPNAPALIAFSDGLRGHPIRLVDHAGKTHGTLPAKSWDGFQGMISPDGKTFAAIGFPKGLTAEVSVVRIEDKQVLARYPIRDKWETWDSPAFAGWAARGVALVESRDLMGTLPLSGSESPKSNVERFDLEGGTRELVFRFPVQPRSLSIAYKTLG